MSAPAAGSTRTPIDRPLRVALVGEYPVDEDAIHEGGIQSVTHGLAHALARRPEIECHVACAARAPRTLYRQLDRLHVHFVPRLPLPRLATNRLHDVPRLVRLLRRLAPDVVHGQGQDRHGLASVRAGLPSVVTPHGVVFVESALLRRHALDLPGALRKWLLDRTEREVFRRARDMIIISPYLPKIYGPLLSARPHLIENPIDPAFFDLRREPVAGRILFAGTVVPRKRVVDLVQALAHLRHPLPGESRTARAWRTTLELRIAGPLVDPASVGEVRAAIAAHRLEGCVTLTGALSQEALLEEYRRAQILALASREETAPQVIAQAMACGLPTVASRAGGVPQMVRDGETALLFPVGDVQAGADRMRLLLTEEGRRCAMGERIREEARQRFHPDAVAEQTVAVYRQIVGG